MHSTDLKMKVLSLHKEEKSIKEISTITGLPYETIRKMIKPTYSKTNVKVGRPNKVGKKEMKVINECVKRLKRSGEKITSKKIISNTKLTCSSRTIQRSLQKTIYRWKKVPQKIELNEIDKKKRLDHIKEWISQGIKFNNVIFTDEKRFSLDGPDNYIDWISGNENIHRKRRQMGGGGLMIHAMVFYDGYVHITKLDKTLNSENYQEIVVGLLEIAKDHFTDFIWMHDGAPAHRSHSTKEFFLAKGVNILQWPPKSPDLNIVENLWAYISQKVYENQQYRKLADLWEEIQNQVAKINNNEKDMIKNLFNSIPTRLIKCIEKKGDIM